MGLELNGWVGADANDYNFGPDMLSAIGAALGIPTPFGVPVYPQTVNRSSTLTAKTPNARSNPEIAIVRSGSVELRFIGGTGSIR